ncbi:fam-i protein [Plasmodium gallinaceum]|uniref:Fam-i protein n=1 Tax=Plasmodium gallinaceum TaxID=5849 RepID=A0A1J1GSS4_PLAGA|nr:fam-i protein [Plasmodium gallinaceum]CRG95494.1 fam-i protein [Plasmodium gallinaceum]
MDLNLSDAISNGPNERLNEEDSTADFAHRTIKDANVSIPENPLYNDLNLPDAIQNPSKDINLDSATSKKLLHKKSLSIFQLVIIIISFLRFKRAHSTKWKAKRERDRLQKIWDNSSKELKGNLEKEMLDVKNKMEDCEKKLLKKKKEMELWEKGVLREKEVWERRTRKEKQECGESMLKQLEDWEKRVLQKGEDWEKRKLIEKEKLEKEILKNKEEGEEKMLKIMKKLEKKILKEKESGWLIKGFIKLFGNKKN